MADIDDVKAALDKAIKHFEYNEKLLIKNDVQERAMMFRLAFYLQTELVDARLDTRGLIVDCEYNRTGTDTDAKKFVLLDRKYVEDDLGGQLTEGAKVAPDIIVHRRGEEGQSANVLVIEIKKVTNPDRAGQSAAIERDRQRLQVFTRHQAFQYQSGCLLKIGKAPNGAPKIEPEWFASQ